MIGSKTSICSSITEKPEQRADSPPRPQLDHGNAAREQSPSLCEPVAERRPWPCTIALQQGDRAGRPPSEPFAQSCNARAFAANVVTQIRVTCVSRRLRTQSATIQPPESRVSSRCGAIQEQIASTSVPVLVLGRPSPSGSSRMMARQLRGSERQAAVAAEDAWLELQSGL
jgi:hypothetical protein